MSSIHHRNLSQGHNKKEALIINCLCCPLVLSALCRPRRRKWIQSHAPLTLAKFWQEKKTCQVVVAVNTIETFVERMVACCCHYGRQCGTKDYWRVVGTANPPTTTDYYCDV